jgi:chemotaxis response regulator CheB
MPRSAAEAGVVHRVVPLLQIPEQIVQLAHYKKAARASV